MSQFFGGGCERGKFLKKNAASETLNLDLDGQLRKVYTPVRMRDVLENAVSETWNLNLDRRPICG